MSKEPEGMFGIDEETWLKTDPHAKLTMNTMRVDGTYKFEHYHETGIIQMVCREVTCELSIEGIGERIPYQTSMLISIKDLGKVIDALQDIQNCFENE